VEGSQVARTIEEDRIEHGKRSLGIGFRLTAGAVTELYVYYTVPVDVRQGYRLYIQKQAGIPARPTSVVISDPGGITRASITGQRDEQVTADW
jgi:hypothetical protein